MEAVWLGLLSVALSIAVIVMLVRGSKKGEGK